MRVRQLSLGIALLTIGLMPPVHAQQAAQAPPLRTPDVIFVPTPPEVVDAMLKVAEVSSSDVVYDLGCGDGIIVATAAQKFGATAVGIDIDPQRVKEATDRIQKANVTDKVKILNQDLFTTDISQATVVTLVPAAVVESEADSEVEQGAEAWHAGRLPELQHGRSESATEDG